MIAFMMFTFLCIRVERLLQLSHEDGHRPLFLLPALPFEELEQRGRTQLRPLEYLLKIEHSLTSLLRFGTVETTCKGISNLYADLLSHLKLKGQFNFEL